MVAKPQQRAETALLRTDRTEHGPRIALFQSALGRCVAVCRRYASRIGDGAGKQNPTASLSVSRARGVQGAEEGQVPHAEIRLHARLVGGVFVYRRLGVFYLDYRRRQQIPRDALVANPCGQRPSLHKRLGGAKISACLARAIICAAISFTIWQIFCYICIET